jgi:hypothetical protein
MQCRSTAHMQRLTCVWCAPWQLETSEQKTTQVKTPMLLHAGEPEIMPPYTLP